MAKTIPWKHMGIEGKRESYVQQLQREEKEKAQWFIAQLVKGGVSRAAVATNDFTSNLIPRVYITIPYGRKGGGNRRGYQRWNSLTVKQAISFYKRGIR